MVGVSRLELLTSRSQSARATNCAKPRTMNVLYHIYARIKSMKSFFQSHKRALCIFGPVLIGLIYILLCIANLNQSIWFDESYGAYLVRFKFSDIVHFTSVDVHPPLYYFLLKIWAHFLGFNAFSMRLLSTMLGAGAILFAFKWLKYKYGTKIAFVGSLALATSPFIVRYGQEMRMYTLVLLIFFAATYFMQIAIDTKKKVFWVIYAILIATGMWTHYFMAFAWCAQLVYILSIYKLDFFKKKLFLVYVLAVLLFAPWIPYLNSQFHSVQQDFWIPEVSVQSLTSAWTEFTIYSSGSMASNWTILLIIVHMITYIFIVSKSFKKQRYLSILATIPILLLILISLPPFKSMFVPRYVLYSAACIVMMPAIGLTILIGSDKKLKKKSSKKQKLALGQYAAMSIILIVTTVFGLFNLYSNGNYNFSTGEYPTAKQLYENIDGLSAENDAIVVSAKTPLLIYDLSFYSSDKHPVLFFNDEMEYQWGSLLPLKESYFGRIDDSKEFKENNPSFWYVGDGLDSLTDTPEGMEIIEEASLQLHEKGVRYTLWKLRSKDL